MIGLGDGKMNEDDAGSPGPDAAARTISPRTKPPRSGSKLARVIALLERPEGASFAELMAATGWVPHTTRAALTGLRKRGLNPRTPQACGRHRGLCDPDGRRGCVMAARSSKVATTRVATDPALDGLSALDLDSLRSRWLKLTGRLAPCAFRRKLLARAFAYEIQVAEHGGLPPAVRRRLRQLALAEREGRFEETLGTAPLKRGTLLVRLWQGQTHQGHGHGRRFCLERRHPWLALGDRQGDHRDKLEALRLLAAQGRRHHLPNR